jgi:hypothetical protein
VELEETKSVQLLNALKNDGFSIMLIYYYKKPNLGTNTSFLMRIIPISNSFKSAKNLFDTETTGFENTLAVAKKKENRRTITEYQQLLAALQKRNAC